MEATKPTTTPIDINKKFTSVEFDEHVGAAGADVLTDISAYQRFIGRLIYLTITRPDIKFVVQTLCQFMQSPKQSYWEATVRVVKYIKQSYGDLDEQ